MNSSNRKGETARVTQRNAPVAEQVPANNAGANSPRGLAADIRRLRKGIKLGKTTIRELTHEGHRY